MFARLLAALCCLLNTALCFGQTEPVSPSEHRVVVYLRAGSSQPLLPLGEMKREAGLLMDAAGFRLSWKTIADSDSVENASVVVVELRGSCNAPATSKSKALPVEASLASTAVVNGEVLPFSWVECGTLANLLTTPLTHEPDAKRQLLYGRAMGRLIAHELFHILANTDKHERAGIAKSSFSSTDLLAERFQFESATLAKLRDTTPADSDSDDYVAVGR